jgi:hypothetical protein
LGEQAKRPIDKKLGEQDKRPIDNKQARRLRTNADTLQDPGKAPLPKQSVVAGTIAPGQTGGAPSLRRLSEVRGVRAKRLPFLF